MPPKAPLQLLAREPLSSDDSHHGGTGTRFGNIVITLAGVAALVASLITAVSIWLQSKNYRKPLLQRYVVRILLMVPIYSAASWASLVSLKAASWIDPLRDVYEAFTIYTFLQLLINVLGGERSVIIMTYGRPPVSHLWPLDQCLPKVDISDPYTFLALKRGILQYAWIKPLLAIATIVMKATNTYQEGYIGISSGYFWSGLVYNVSITVCLYALAMFWACMHQDLKSFRPVPKFLCIKGIIFASYWQGFFLSILVWLGALPDSVPGYSPDNLAAAIQDALICFEMPAFAIGHWYAFSWHDYADPSKSAARLPVKHAFRDAFGPRDLIQDTKDTFAGKNYVYRKFDATDAALAHEQSSSRTARMMAGMRYERGKGKYWIPEPGQSSKTPLLDHSRARTMSPGVISQPSYGTTSDEPEEPTLDAEEEHLYQNARALEFGDWNYPVITAHTAIQESSQQGLLSSLTPSSLSQPIRPKKKRRKQKAPEGEPSGGSGEPEAASRGGSASRETEDQTDRPQAQPADLRRQSSHHSQLVDLVIKDPQAESNLEGTETLPSPHEGPSRIDEEGRDDLIRVYSSPREDGEEPEGGGPSDHPRQVRFGSFGEERDIWGS